MDLLIKKAQRVIRLDAELGFALCEIFPDYVERIIQPTECPKPGAKPAAAGPQFSLVKSNPFHPDQICIQCKRMGGREVLNYDGHPDYAADYFKQIGADCPAEIVQQYKLVWKQPVDADGIATRKFRPPQPTQLELEAQRRQQVRPASAAGASGEVIYEPADPAKGGQQ